MIGHPFINKKFLIKSNILARGRRHGPVPNYSAPAGPGSRNWQFCSGTVLLPYGVPNLREFDNYSQFR